MIGPISRSLEKDSIKIQLIQKRKFGSLSGKNWMSIPDLKRFNIYFNLLSSAFDAVYATGKTVRAKLMHGHLDIFYFRSLINLRFQARWE
jgi:hypothetical protein